MSASSCKKDGGDMGISTKGRARITIGIICSGHPVANLMGTVGEMGKLTKDMKWRRCTGW